MSLSFSKLQTYRRCPKQYEFAVIKKIPRRISAGESFGSSIHHTLKRWGELEMERQYVPEMKKQLVLFTEDEQGRARNAPIDLTVLLTLFRECFIAEGYECREDRDIPLKRGESILKDFFDWWKREQREIVTIESGFKLLLSRHKKELILSGRFDRVERTKTGVRIIDYKTSAARTQEEVDADLQLSIYALAAAQQWDEPVTELVLLFLTEDGLIERRTTRTSAQLNEATMMIRSLEHGIESEDFHATPSREKCRHCPYREMCPFRAPTPNPSPLRGEGELYS